MLNGKQQDFFEIATFSQQLWVFLQQKPENVHKCLFLCSIPQCLFYKDSIENSLLLLILKGNRRWNPVQHELNEATVVSSQSAMQDL